MAEHDGSRNVRLLWLAGLTALLSSCTGRVYVRGEWPEEIPEEPYYLAAYERDVVNQEKQPLQDYFDWVLRFYYGYGPAQGWKLTERAMIRILDPGDKEKHWVRILALGQLISAEWAKHNETRKVHTDMLQLWGRVLRGACDCRCVEDALQRLEGDVKALVGGGLQRKEINPKRYEDILALAKKKQEERDKAEEEAEREAERAGK